MSMFRRLVDRVLVRAGYVRADRCMRGTVSLSSDAPTFVDLVLPDRYGTRVRGEVVSPISKLGAWD